MEFLEKIKTFVREHKIKSTMFITSIIGIFFLFFLVSNIDIEDIMKKVAVTSNGIKQEVYLVKRGDIDKTIKKKGVLSSINRYEVTSLVEGEIKEDYFEEGETVQKGDLLYLIRSDELDNNIATAKLEIKKAQIDYNNSVKNCNNLFIQANGNGTVTNLYIKSGDIVSEGTKIADIVNSEQMILKINFLSEDAKNFFVGESAVAILSNNGDKIDGVVSYKATGNLKNDYGVPVTPVEITINNPGMIKASDKALAMVGNYSCNSMGEFENFYESTIYSTASGTIKKVYKKKGDIISKEMPLVEIENYDLQIQKEQSLFNLENAKMAYDNYVKQLENYKIKAPIDGKIVQKNIKAGENTLTSSMEAMAIIEDVSGLVFTIEIDESDVLDLVIGQNVSIFADALENERFEGLIASISSVANAENGISTYPVKILLSNNNSTNLIAGMNVTASIDLGSRKNVICVPSKAIKSGGEVLLIKDKKETEYETEIIKVELGLNDGKNVEIIKGLKIGDEILIESD